VSGGTRDESESEKDAHKVGENVTRIRHNDLHELEGGLDTHVVHTTKFWSCSRKGRGSGGNISMREWMCVSSCIGRTEG